MVLRKYHILRTSEIRSCWFERNKRASCLWDAERRLSHLLLIGCYCSFVAPMAIIVEIKPFFSLKKTRKVVCYEPIIFYYLKSKKKTVACVSIYLFFKKKSYLVWQIDSTFYGKIPQSLNMPSYTYVYYRRKRMWFLKQKKSSKSLQGWALVCTQWLSFFLFSTYYFLTYYKNS